MEMKARPLASRLLSLFLAICIAAGFVPLIDYSVFAVDNETTIGELEQNVPRSGNGWSWDGNDTLNLFGTELKSKDNDTPKISYSGSALTITVTGYNRAVGNSLLAESDSRIDIQGNGILDVDSESALLDCEEAYIAETLIKAPDATLFKDGVDSKLEYNGGYLEINTINSINAFMDAGVIKCKKMQYDGSHGWLEFYQNGGVLYADKVSVENENQCYTIYFQGNSIFKANATEVSATGTLKFRQLSGTSIVMLGDTNAGYYSSNNFQPVDVNGMNVYCSAVSSDGAISADTDVAGVYYTADNVKIGNNVILSGAVYFAGFVSLDRSCDRFTVANDVTVAGSKSFTAVYGKTLVSEESTVCFDGDIELYGATVEGSIYGGLISHGRTAFTTSTIKGGVYALGYSMFENSHVYGSATVYCTSPNNSVYLNSSSVDGTLSIYDGNSHDRKKLMSIISSTFGENAEIAAYMADDYEICSDATKFDTAVGSKAFYSAADLGGEYKSTVSSSHNSCGKLIYVGKEFEERFDTAFNYSSWINNGHGYVLLQRKLSLDPADSQKAYFAYNCTHYIDFDDVKVIITKGTEARTSDFDIDLSHYYYTDSPDNANEKSLGIEISAAKDSKLVAGDEYKVTVEYNGTTFTENIEVTGVNTTLNFAGDAAYYAYATWNYDGGTFTDVNTDCAGNTWAWYANGNTELGYLAKTLVLNGIDFASSALNAVIVPAGTTIILKGENRLYATTSAIRSCGDLTIKGENGGSLTAVSSELANDNSYGSSFDAVIKIYGYSYEPYTLLIKDAKLDLTAKKTAAVGSSNSGCVNCYCISSDNVVIDNSEITANAGPAGQVGLKSACIMAEEQLTLRGKTTLDLTSEQYAIYARNGIASVELNKLDGADVSLEDFNSSLKSNNNCFTSSIDSTSVYLETKPLDQFEAVKTADILDPDDGKQTMELAKYFFGGSGSYVFEPADGVTLPDWITLAQDGTLTLDTPDIEFPGGVYKLLAMDKVVDLRSDPLEFELTVGIIGHTVNLTVDYDSKLGTVTPGTGKVLAGVDTTIAIEANDGMYVDSVTFDGDPVELTAAKTTSVGRIVSGTYTIEKISADHAINVVFKEIPTYTVAVSKSGSGTVTVETESLAGRLTNTYYEGTDVVISAVAEDGCCIKNVMLDDETVTLTDGKYTIKSIKANCAFTVEFEEIPSYDLTVNVNNTEYGTFTTDYTGSLTEVPEGTVIKFTATPNKGYKLTGATVNGANVNVTANSFSVTVTESMAVKITFDKSSSGSSGGSGVSSGGRVNVDYDTPPSINGATKTWSDICSDLGKLTPGSSTSISLNGNTTVPSDVIRIIKDKKLKVEFIIDSVKSWTIDGADITSATDADLSAIERISDTGGLRGACAADIRANGTALPAVLRLKLDKKHAGKYANIYRISGRKFVFCCSLKIGADGTVDFPGAVAGGEYIVMVCEYTDLPGDISNDGVLNAFDASAVLKYVVGLGGAVNPEMADINGDGVIDAEDARVILKAIINS